MSIKDSIVHAAEVVGDKLNELTHKAEAHAEHEKRELAGDAMTPGEHLESLAHEGSETIKGAVDHVKSDLH